MEMTLLNDMRWRRLRTVSAAFALGACMAGATGSVLAADSFLVYSGDPPTSHVMPNYSLVPLNGNVLLDGADFYERVMKDFPASGSRLPTDQSKVRFWLNYKYIATSGDTYTYEVPMPASGYGTFAGSLPKGYYRKMNFGFRWADANGAGQELAFRSTDDFTMARIVVPNVQKIPVYAYAEWMNEGYIDPFPMLSDTVRMRNKFRNLDYPISRLATNLNNEFKNNFGCAGWFQFRFYGFVSGFERGIRDDGDMARLPPGITVVPSITYCNGSRPERVSGCATHNGTRIAIDAAVFNLGVYTLQEAIVTLHEIAHTKGLDHTEAADNLLSEVTSNTSVAIREDQCPAISVAKRFVTPDPWEQ